MDYYEHDLNNSRKLSYLFDMRPVLNFKALFADMTEDYISPQEPDAFSVATLRFRTGRNNVDGVILVQGNERHRMDPVSSCGEFDYYETQILVEDGILSYYYEIYSGRLTIWYGRKGIALKEEEIFPFRLMPGFSIPDWCKGAVMYQIYTDRFYNGDPTNDVESREYFYLGDYAERVTDWDSYPSQMDVRRFYGGDLKGVMMKLPYLKSLGVEAIYFNPLFVSPSNHKYDSQDYDYIDPHIGTIIKDGGSLLDDTTDNKKATRYIQRTTCKENLEASNALFASLVQHAHECGIKVILDGVFNHCGSFHKWLDREEIYEGAEGYEKGAYISKDSPYKDYFRFQNVNSWPYNGSYEGWWGHDTLPKLNYEGSEELCQYILNVARKWVSPPYNADGWRLDVAADLGHSLEFNHEFWKRFRAAVKDANRNAVIIAEHYGDAKEWLKGDEWDTVMNYDAFMEPVTWFLTGMQKHSDEYRPDLLNNADAFWGTMEGCRGRFSMGSLLSAMNQLSNHDHSRFLTRTNHKVGRINTLGPSAAEQDVNKAVMREAVLIQMTWPGAPTIYYGDEAGLCGFTDPDSRRPYPWGNEDFELMDFHRACIRLHNENRELRTGSLMKLMGEPGILAYARFNQHGASVVMVNNNNFPIERTISVWQCGVPLQGRMKRVLLSTDISFMTDPLEIPVNDGRIQLSLPPTGGILLKARLE